MYPIAETEQRLFPPLVLQGGRRSLVLVVEDHVDTRALLKVLLNHRGLEVIEAGDGEEAVIVAECEQPDLILMDAVIPHLDGVEAMRRIREIATLAEVPVVFITGYAEPGFRAAAFEAGCSEYIEKPFDLTLFDRAITKHLRLNER
jgi:CheY-like chemotaxis protein